MALKADGSVWTWGWGRFGESGTGELGSNIKTTPVRVKGGESGSNYLTDIVVVLIGKTHSMALKSNGSVWAWGMNRRGELGNGTKDHALTPVQVKGANGNGHLTNIVAVAAGKMYHSIALKSDGSVWAWGDGGAGQLGDGTSGQNVYSAIPVRVKGGESGSNYLTDIVAVSAGFDCSIALKSNGSVWSWGWNTSGQLGDGTSGTSLNPYLIRAYPVQVKGANGNGHLTDIAAVTAGEFHSMALNSDGSVWAWGNNSAGQLGNGMSGGNANKSTPVEVSAQLLKLNYATIIDKNTAIPIEVFDKNNPMPSVIRIKANQKFKVDRSRITKYPGFNLIYDSTPVDPSKASFEIMDGRIAAATSGGEVVSTGTAYGYTQLVIKEADSGFVRVIPIGVMPERAVAVPQVALGGHCIALKSDGSVWAWGLNIYGQLGE